MQAVCAVPRTGLSAADIRLGVTAREPGVMTATRV